MEKLVYTLWRRPELDERAFCNALRGPVAEALAKGGARHRVLNLVDEHVAYAREKRLTRLSPTLDGVAAFWLDVCDDRGECEAALRSACARIAGYLVVESVPLRNTLCPAPLGERTPGANLIGLLERPQAIPWPEWVRIWHGLHRAVALETQCTFLYERNLVVRPLSDDAPPFAGIVMEGFPRDAVTDPMQWYKADGSKARLHENLSRMIESCKRFLELDRVESHPMSEYVLDPQP